MVRVPRLKTHLLYLNFLHIVYDNFTTNNTSKHYAKMSSSKCFFGMFPEICRLSFPLDI